MQHEGIDVVVPTYHTLFKSIYFFDPNGHRLEFVFDEDRTPKMHLSTQLARMGVNVLQ
nr:hypothetical protein [Paraburkholderia sp. HP33-1]